MICSQIGTDSSRHNALSGLHGVQTDPIFGPDGVLVVVATVGFCDGCIGIDTRPTETSIIRLQDVAIAQNNCNMPLISRIPIQTTYKSPLRVVLPNVEDFSYTFVIVVVVVGVSSAVPIRITKGGYLLAHGAEHEIRNARTETTLSNDLLGWRGRSVLRPRGRTVRHWPFCPPAIRCLHNAQPVIYC